ncbi:MAG: 16S rRNA (cytidine(1402)-2'-O)-methyltransferase [Anaerolineales bacterium]|nr:16S rRNA (cytidine(1402)-2'-O)-methyltransferase [Anaerolineales bacterium]
MGTLYLVATPIGNLEDISARALRILRESSIIAAEDTRHTHKLLQHYGIQTDLTSYHEHSKPQKLSRLMSDLETGDVALVSDAGTPGLNDPGYELVRAALENGHNVSPIPGPNAPIAALVASGLPTDTFLYLGYLPKKSSERRRLLAQVADQPHTLIFLETPHRLLVALEELQENLGDRQIAAARELTKLYEEIFRGTISETHAHFMEKKPRGEFTLVVSGHTLSEERWSIERLHAALDEACSQGLPPSQVSSQIASESGWPRREIYQMLTKLRRYNDES